MADDDQQTRAVVDNDTSGAETTDASPAEVKTTDQAPVDESKREDSSGEDSDSGSSEQNKDQADAEDGKPRRPDKRQRTIERLTTANSQVLKENEELRERMQQLGINPNQSAKQVSDDLVSQLGLEEGRDYTREELNGLLQKEIDNRLAETNKSVQSQVQLEVQRQLAERERAEALRTDIDSVRTEYGELNPDDKDNYDPDLDELVAEAYENARTKNPDVRLKDIVNKQLTVLRKQAERKTADAQASIVDNADALNPTSGDSGGRVDSSRLSSSEFAAKQGLKVVE